MNELLKTLKRTRQVTLDELIRHVWKNKEYPVSYKTVESDTRTVEFDIFGYLVFGSNNSFSSETKFEITEEEVITDKTEFDQCIVLFKKNVVHIPVKSSIKKILDTYVDPEVIYAFIDGNLEMIWKKKGMNDD